MSPLVNIAPLLARPNMKLTKLAKTMSKATKATKQKQN